MRTFGAPFIAALDGPFAIPLLYGIVRSPLGTMRLSR